MVVYVSKDMGSTFAKSSFCLQIWRPEKSFKKGRKRCHVMATEWPLHTCWKALGTNHIAAEMHFWQLLWWPLAPTPGTLCSLFCRPVYCGTSEFPIQCAKIQKLLHDWWCFAVNHADFKIKMGKQKIIGQLVDRRWYLFEIHTDYAFLY